MNGRFPRRLRATGGLALVLWLVLITSGCFLGGPTQSALATSTTLSIIAGTVQVRPAGQSNFRATQDGMTLQAGDQVKTLANSHALITFFEGSTVEVEPDNEVTIQAPAGQPVAAPSSDPAQPAGNR